MRTTIIRFKVNDMLLYLTEKIHHCNGMCGLLEARALDENGQTVYVYWEIDEKHIRFDRHNPNYYIAMDYTHHLGSRK